jgi:hypothetical protein
MPRVSRTCYYNYKVLYKNCAEMSFPAPLRTRFQASSTLRRLTLNGVRQGYSATPFRKISDLLAFRGTHAKDTEGMSGVLYCKPLPADNVGCALQ